MTCLPAATAASTTAAWVSGEVATVTASTPGRPKAASRSVVAKGTSNMAARSAVLPGWRPTSASTRNPAARSARRCVSTPKPVPTTAAPSGCPSAIAPSLCVRKDATGERSPVAQGAEELPQLGDDGLGVLEGRKMPATVDRLVAAEVVPRLDELTRWCVGVLEQRQPRRHVDPPGLRDRRPETEGLVVQAHRRTDRPREPVDRDVGEQLVPGVDAQEVALTALVGAVAP